MATPFRDILEGDLIGESEEGRPVFGFVLGDGPRTASLVAGAHAEEPVGPETLRTVVETGRVPDGWRFVVVPHINPDGAARNAAWIHRWPDPLAFWKHHRREPPGRDIEFGYPDLRPENVAVAGFLRRHGPYDLHMSLHGMAVADGAMLLIERTWGYRTRALQQRWADAVGAAGLTLHDRNRQGEKGFFYLAPGFQTTPEGAAMRAYFRARGDDKTAALFLDSSMEFVRSLGGDPLCLVTEIPLFVAEGPVPTTAQELRALDTPPPVTPVPVETAIRLQLCALEEGIRAVERRLEAR